MTTISTTITNPSISTEISQPSLSCTISQPSLSVDISQPNIAVDISYPTISIDLGVNDVKLYEPDYEEHRGSECDGSDFAANRVLTLNNTSMTLDDRPFVVFINGRYLHQTQEYTVSHKTASTEITFLTKIPNTAYIVVSYFI